MPLELSEDDVPTGPTSGVEPMRETPSPSSTQSHSCDPGLDLNAVAMAAAQDVEDRDGLATLFQHMYEPVVRYLETKVKDPATAEDLAQDTFARVVERIDTYTGAGVWSWVFRIADNACTDHYRPMRNRGYEQPAETWRFDQPSHDLGPAETVEWSELGRALNQKINRLRPDYREVLRLRLMVGLTPTQTAEVMARKVGTIRVLHYRALKALRKELPASATAALYLLSASPDAGEDDVMHASHMELREKDDVAGASG
ncbi:RNA polymerase sigma factor [Streptomyces sp. NPDC058758]|uniref:RNA polymerase sigma factor n=1 Tax=Streptomyces sp. NPDC058758 TaxID=3346627 RepID=UPI0036CAA13E